MAHQSSQVRAGVTRLLDPNYPEPEAHHNKPEEHEPPKDDVDYNSLEEALLGDS